MYLAPLLNLPPRGAYSDAKLVQQFNLLNARGANMVIYCSITRTVLVFVEYTYPKETAWFCLHCH